VVIGFCFQHRAPARDTAAAQRLKVTFFFLVFVKPRSASTTSAFFRFSSTNARRSERFARGTCVTRCRGNQLRRPLCALLSLGGVKVAPERGKFSP